MLAHEIRIARIFGVNRHGGVAQHGFGACGGHHDEAVRLTLDGIAQVPEIALHLNRLDFKVRNGGQQLGSS